MNNARIVQERFYEQTALGYDDSHSSEEEHQIALRYMNGLLSLLAISSILDVGCGTGRGLSFLVNQQPLATAIGIEPVKGLLRQAIYSNNITRERLICGSGEHLPFENGSFDAVCELAVLHHVKDPNIVVKEMTRVARKAVFLSDSNRFGQGRLSVRVGKLLLYKLGLWRLANFILTKGKGFKYSEGDGVFFSYSVYDSYNVLAAWADRIILIPTGNVEAKSWLHPLLTSANILVCAIKD